MSKTVVLNVDVQTMKRNRNHEGMLHGKMEIYSPLCIMNEYKTIYTLTLYQILAVMPEHRKATVLSHLLSYSHEG